MQTPVEQLQALADQWAAKLGGKIPVCLNLLVHAGPGRSTPHFGAYIGGVLEDKWVGHAPTAEKATSEAERKWLLDGAPADPRDAEKAKLKARAKELGLTVVEDTPEALQRFKVKHGYSLEMGQTMDRR